MKKNNNFFEIKNLAQDTAEIRIYGTITKWAWEEYGEVSSANFVKELNKYKNVSKIHLRINSAGGDVFEANAIYNFLKDFAKENKIEIIGYIDGLAASAASFLILAASKITMGLGALYMIHNPWTYAAGDSSKLAKQIELLDKIKDSILDIYMTKSKKTREEISSLMNSEKWFSAKEALEYGFVDEIIEDDNTLENIENISNNINIMCFMNKKLIEEKLNAAKKIKEEKEVIKNLQELKTTYSNFLNEYKEEIKAELEAQHKLDIENAIKNERERIKELESIPILNEKQKEVVNKAKFETPAEPRDIMAEFYMSNANKANEEIRTIKNEQSISGIDKINPSISNEIGDNATFDAVCNAALKTYNK